MESTAKKQTVQEIKPTPPGPTFTENTFIVLSSLAFVLASLAFALLVIAVVQPFGRNTNESESLQMVSGLSQFCFSAYLTSGLFRCAAELMKIGRILDTEQHTVKTPAKFSRDSI